MFEQELFNQNATVPEPHEGDLFYDYEIRTWNFSPRIYKILAVSAIVNILGLFVFAQTNVLTTRGCDSPFVGRVCQVLDMAYVGTVLFGTDREYVDMAYEKTDLGDAEIVWIDQTGVAPHFSYPTGYFYKDPALVAAEQSIPGSDGFSSFTNPIPGVAPNPTINNDLATKAPKFPKYNPNAVKGDEVDSPFAFEGDENADPSGRKGGRKGNANNTNANIDPGKNPTVADNDPNNNTNTQTPANGTSAIVINKRPMVDLANFVNELREKNQLNLESPFIVNAKGKLDKTGKLDPKTFKFLPSQGDEKMVEIVEESISAFNVAGYLQYLKDLSGKDFNLLLQQDDINISADVRSEMESDTRAKAIKSSIDLAISIAKLAKTKEGADQNDKDDLLLLENAKVEVEGKKVIIRFVIPKAIAHPLIQRKLAEQAAELKKPSGNATTGSNNNTASK
ncbi:MAG: hypothetical protein ACT4O9_12695 [Blastocatellia bacterium]